MLRPSTMFRWATTVSRSAGLSPANSGHSVRSSTMCAPWALRPAYPRNPVPGTHGEHCRARPGRHRYLRTHAMQDLRHIEGRGISHVVGTGLERRAEHAYWHVSEISADHLTGEIGGPDPPP